MNTTTHLDHSGTSLAQRVFTRPTSKAFTRWVAIINFWILISCLSLAGETVEPYATEQADLFKWIEYSAVLFFTVDYLGNLFFAKDRVKYFFSFWGLVDLISILPTYLTFLNLSSLQGTKVNLPLLDVPLSHSIMRPSIAVPRASFSQTASG